MIELRRGENETMASVLRRKAENVMGECLPRGVRYCLLDYPQYNNVGDSGIWLGEIELLKSLGMPSPFYTCSVEDYEPGEIRRAGEESPILLSGGGNLGDLWPRHQAFRERVLSDFPRRNIIQLSQTLYFREKRNLEAFARKVDKLQSFTLLLRDRSSYEVATKILDCRVELCPDMALMLELRRAGAPKFEILDLLRTDREAIPGVRQIRQLSQSREAIVDWLEYPRGIWQGLWESFGGFAAKHPSCKVLIPNSIPNWLRAATAREKVSYGCALLSGGKFVVTDRLHAHIFCALMEIPHVVVDTKYGKIRSVMETWGTGGCVAGYVQKLEELEKEVAKLTEKS